MTNTKIETVFLINMPYRSDAAAVTGFTNQFLFSVTDLFGTAVIMFHPVIHVSVACSGICFNQKSV